MVVPRCAVLICTTEDLVFRKNLSRTVLATRTTEWQVPPVRVDLACAQTHRSRLGSRKEAGRHSAGSRDAVAEDLLWPTMAAAIPKILKSTYHSVQHKRKGDGADHSLQIILLFFLSPLRFLLFFYISAIPGFTVVLRH